MKQIEEGKIKIPTFQRDYIWKNNQKTELFESLSWEYPIGSILLWKPNTTFKNKTEIGPYTIDDSISQDCFYILDGFQRLSTIFGCLTNPKKTKLICDETKFKKEFSIYYDLEKEEFNVPRTTPSDITNIPIYVLIDTFEFLDYSDKLRKEINDNQKSTDLLEKARKLSSTLIDYSLPSIEIIGGEIGDAVEIFSRINSKGTVISSDWMVSALTTNETQGFNLGASIDKLLIELKQFNFDGIKRELILQCIQNSFGKIYFDFKIEELVKRSDFIEKADKTIDSIKKATQFLFEELSIIDRKLLPYNSQLIFITYFFNEVENPSAKQKEQLKNWFWVTTYSNYFTIYSLSKIRVAFDQFKKFIRQEVADPVYNDKPNIPFMVAEFPKSVFLGSVRSSALVLFLLNHSNKFKKLNSETVENIKIPYLFHSDTSINGVIPVIEYTNEAEDKLPFVFNKPIDMSFLFDDNNFSIFADSYFLNQKMKELYHNNKIEEILNIRVQLIKQAEKKFVESFGIIYDN
jgi:hypothetical protein